MKHVSTVLAAIAFSGVLLVLAIRPARLDTHGEHTRPPVLTAEPDSTQRSVSVPLPLPISTAEPSPVSTAAKPPPAALPERPGLAGMIIGIDPETGELGMPTPEQREELERLQIDESVDHSDEGLVEVHHPDGHVSVDLQGRFQEYMTVRVDRGGKIVFECVDREQDAKKIVESVDTESAPPGAAEER